MLPTYEFMKKYFISDDKGNIYAKDGLSDAEIEEILDIDDWNLAAEGKHFIQNREELENRLSHQHINMF